VSLVLSVDQSSDFIFELWSKMTRKGSPDPVRVKIAWQDPVMLQVGKGGISEGLIEEARRLLKEHKIVKIRILRSALEGATKIELANLFCERTGAGLAGIRGNTAVIFKKQHK
jgi:RNA-binding protein